MSQKTLGHVEMEWTCRRCGTKNPGLSKTCSNCGAQMEADQQFEKPAEQRLITDAGKLAQIGKGADIHCPFCGTRNPAGAKTCSQCGGDLVKGQKRESGQVVGAFTPGAAAPVTCPACSTQNPAGAQNCQSCGRPLGAAQAAGAPAAALAARPARAPNRLIIGLVAVAAVLCLTGLGWVIFQSLSTSDVSGVVQAVRWERSIGIEARVPVERQNWRDQLPADAQVGTCEERPRELRAAPDPAHRSDEVCGTPYAVDQGDGTSKIVQDCQYQIYDDFCPYTVLEWKEVDRAVAQGDDLSPFWPQLSLAADQREGARDEQYDVTFTAGGRTYAYSVGGEAEFARFSTGSRWTLQVNGLGGVNAVEPAR